MKLFIGILLAILAILIGSPLLALVTGMGFALIFKLPDDFILLNPKRSLNHICQNVPVTTAEHPARMVKEYLAGNLERIETKFLVQDNKKRTYEYEKSSSPQSIHHTPLCFDQ